MKPIRLRSVRPFVFGDVVLADEQEKNPQLKFDTKVKINKFLKAIVRPLSSSIKAVTD